MERAPTTGPGVESMDRLIHEFFEGPEPKVVPGKRVHYGPPGGAREWWWRQTDEVKVGDRVVGHIRRNRNGRLQSNVTVAPDGSFVPGEDVRWLLNMDAGPDAGLREAMRGTYDRAHDGELTFDEWFRMWSARDAAEARAGEEAGTRVHVVREAAPATKVVVREIVREVQPPEPEWREVMTPGGNVLMVRRGHRPNMDVARWLDGTK